MSMLLAAARLKAAVSPAVLKGKPTASLSDFVPEVGGMSLCVSQKTQNCFWFSCVWRRLSKILAIQVAMKGYQRWNLASSLPPAWQRPSESRPWKVKIYRRTASQVHSENWQHIPEEPGQGHNCDWGAFILSVLLTALACWWVSFKIAVLASPPSRLALGFNAETQSEVNLAIGIKWCHFLQISTS